MYNKQAVSRFSIHLFALAALILPPAPAQILLNPPRDPAVITVDVDLVNVLFSVRDRKGVYVKSLERENFQIKENGRQMEIKHFAREVDTPIVVSLLIDVSGSVSRILPIEQAAAARFLKEVMRPTDEALLGSFAAHIAIWQDLTSSMPLLKTALERSNDRIVPRNASEISTRGGTLLYDAISLVARTKMRKKQGRKTMVVITDGLDNGSLASIESSSKDAIESDTVIFAIHYEDDDASDNSGRKGMSALKKLAEPTGGHMFHVDKKTSLDKVFAAIQEEMRSQYAIAFTPVDPKRDGAFRKLEVKTNKPGLKVNTRDGYYALPHP